MRSRPLVCASIPYIISRIVAPDVLIMTSETGVLFNDVSIERGPTSEYVVRIDRESQGADATIPLLRSVWWGDKYVLSVA